ncbi:MAG: VCBS repeat-containing protein [Candidatus Synoicihabitans palmerolidicus]|nr:VCBS repeat-containing protein [Candidatus Synoicihabitans palmerolidicus]
MEKVARVTDARAGDCNGDGRMDLAVAQCGYDQGAVQWLERTGAWTFTPHMLLNLAGAINVLVADFNGDRSPDIATVVSQQWEEVHLFQNDGRGHFTGDILFGSTNDEFASSSIALCDLIGMAGRIFCLATGMGLARRLRPDLGRGMACNGWKTGGKVHFNFIVLET